MNPNPKFDYDVETNDATHTSRDYENVSLTKNELSVKSRVDPSRPSDSLKK